MFVAYAATLRNEERKYKETRGRKMHTSARSNRSTLRYLGRHLAHD